MDQASGCITVRDISAPKFISAYAEVLKNNDKFVVPKWADLVKTGVNKELAPYDPDWYYIRAAAIVRKVYLRQGTGVGALKKRFGGNYRFVMDSFHRLTHRFIFCRQTWSQT